MIDLTKFSNDSLDYLQRATPDWFVGKPIKRQFKDSRNKTISQESAEYIAESVRHIAEELRKVE